MHRLVEYSTVLFLLPVISCDSGSRGPAEAAASQASPGTVIALVDAPQDTLPVTMRRVWSGPRVHYAVSPSPDGRFLSISEGRNLAVRNIETGETRRLEVAASTANAGFITWSEVSPDGRQIAYDWWSERSEGWELRVVDWDGSNSRVVHDDENTGYIRPHDWSPDGRFVLAVMRRGESTPARLVLVETTNGATTELEELSSWPQAAVFSPDGRFIAYDQSGKNVPQRDIFVLAVDGSRKGVLVGEESNDFLLGWAPTGHHILFCSDRMGTPGIWLLPVTDGRSAGEPELVMPDTWGVVPVGFVSDGSYFYGVQTGTRHVYVAALGADLSSVASPPTVVTQPLEGGSAFPAWSPDGRHLAYLQGTAVVVHSLETGEIREVNLAQGLRPQFTPRWAPDGRTLVLVAGNALGPTGIYLVDVQTGRWEALVEEQLPPWPQDGFDLSPDGRYLFYRGLAVDAGRGPIVRIVKQDLRGGGAQVLHSVDFAKGHFRNLAVSPDGSTLAISSLRDRGGGYEHWLEVLPSAGGEAKKLLSVPFISSVAWTPDGKAILYSGGEGQTRLWRIDAEGGEPELVGLEMEEIHHLRLHPDGRRLAFTAGKTATELWVMEGLLPGSR